MRGAATTSVVGTIACIASAVVGPASCSALLASAGTGASGMVAAVATAAAGSPSKGVMAGVEGSAVTLGDSGVVKADVAGDWLPSVPAPSPAGASVS